MRSTALVNATLREVRKGGGLDRWDADGDDGALTWSGAVGCWYEEQRDRRVQNDQSTVILWRSLSVSADLGIDWRVGAVVSFERAGMLRKGSVKAVEDDETPAGVAGEVRLTLELA